MHWGKPHYLRKLAADSLTCRTVIQQLYRFLLNYRATPHLTTKHAPAELLLNREIRTKLPSKFHKKISELGEEVRKNDIKAKQIMKENADRKSRAKERIAGIGDLVLVRQKRKNKFSTKFDPRPYHVVRVKGTMITACRDGHYVTRNISFYKKLPNRDDVQFDNGFEKGIHMLA